MFIGASKSGDPLMGGMGGFSNRVFYNPHSGGTWYVYTNDAFTNSVHISAGTGMSFYLSDGTTATGYLNGDVTASGTAYKLRAISRAELGLPAIVTAPLTLKAVE
jgi:hypothetical protein